MTDTSKAEAPARDGLSLIIFGIVLAPLAGPFFFSVSYLGVLTYPLLLAALLILGAGLSRRARVRNTSLFAAWGKALIYVVGVTVLAYGILAFGRG